MSPRRLQNIVTNSSAKNSTSVNLDYDLTKPLIKWRFNVSLKQSAFLMSSLLFNLLLTRVISKPKMRHQMKVTIDSRVLAKVCVVISNIKVVLIGKINDPSLEETHTIFFRPNTKATCHISSECWQKMTARGYSRYSLTHQTFYIYIAYRVSR